MRKYGLVVMLAAFVPSLASGQQFIPVLPDSSTLEGVWVSAPEVVPPVSRVVGQQTCAQSKASLSNYFVYAGTRLELEQAGPSRFEGTDFRFIKTPYRGKLYYPQGYASTRTLSSGGLEINRACHVEIFEYTLTGELLFNVDTAELEFSATGAIVNAPGFRHGPMAGVGSWSNGPEAAFRSQCSSSALRATRSSSGSASAIRSAAPCPATARSSRPHPSAPSRRSPVCP
jgi:hypothetical protein